MRDTDLIERFFKADQDLIDFVSDLRAEGLQEYADEVERAEIMIFNLYYKIKYNR